MNAETLSLLDAAGTKVAELTVTDTEDGWYFGSLTEQRFSPALKHSLDWYDEVVENQMLSYLDKAQASIEEYGFQVRYPNGTQRRIYSLHVTKQKEISFRTTPTPPPVWQAKSESA